MANDSSEIQAATDTRRWLLETAQGALGTLSAEAETAGYPYLSVVPFALDASGRPLLQLADIAAHTQNLRADPRSSLLVQQPSTEGDPQSGWRVTLLGRLERVPADEGPEAFARFLERVRRAGEYEETHGFGLYRLNVERVRYIAGFGRICWVPGARVLRAPLGAGLAEAAPGAVAHMNADHAASMVEMCEAEYGFRPQSARMLSLDRAGFLVQTQGPDLLRYFSFGREIDAAALRPAVIEVLARARRRLAHV